MQAAFKFHQKEKTNLVHHFSSFLAAAVSSGSLMMDALISWRDPWLLMVELCQEQQLPEL